MTEIISLKDMDHGEKSIYTCPNIIGYVNQVLELKYCDYCKKEHHQWVNNHG